MLVLGLTEELRDSDKDIVTVALMELVDMGDFVSLKLTDCELELEAVPDEL